MKLLAFLFLIFSSQTWAQSLGDTGRSIRARGMGGVYVPFVGGADALFVNPAALGRGSVLDIKLMELTVGANTELVENLSAFQDIDPNDPTTFNQFYGKKMWAQATGKAAVALPFLALGYLNDSEVSVELHNPAFPQFETYFRNDEAVYLGTAFPLGPGTYLGMSLKRINRWGGSVQELAVSDVADASSLQDIGDRFQNKGTGYGFDLAISTELQAPVLKPTLALVWQDVGSTAFKQTAGTDAPPHIEQNLTFGAGLGVDLPGLDLSLGLEARHLMEPDIELGKKIHVGAEISLPMIDLRAGYNQGYLSYGAGINLLIFQLDAVSYTEETGLYPGQAGDARYMVSLSFDLSFDANFKFTDNNGKRRKLKQRR
ncbi:hypothetical protein [Bdellovibrio bacteriovorus]|uniref:hypothetical protein n=1 Tax=Bdellovibrio TaxID=958 RepID=UPI0035A8B4DF